MATTRKRVASSAPETSATSNPRLELAKAIHGLSQKMEAFGKAAEGLASFTKETLVEFDLEIQAKNEDLARLAEETEHARKRNKTETELYLAEHRYNGAVEILAARDEVPISQAELTQMKASLARLTSEREKEIQDVIAKEKKHSEAALHSAVAMSNLTHKATTAELTATTNQQIKEIESLNQTIANLKDEVAAQRKLTESVANAGRQAPITLQTNGK